MNPFNKLTLMIFLTCMLLVSTLRAQRNGELSLEETIGLAFAVGKETGLSNYYVLANPAAKETLYELLKNESAARYHQNALRMIGYIADSTDVRRLEARIHRDYKGVLTSEQQDAIIATFDALAIMSRREVTGAAVLLDRMLSRSYWKDIGFRWRPAATTYPLNTVDELVSWVLYAQAKSGRLEGLDAKVNQVLKVIGDKQRGEIMAERSSMRILRSVKEQVDANEKEPVSQQVKQQLPSFFNGDLDNPGPRGTKASESAPSGTEPKPPPARGRRTDAKDFGAMIRCIKREIYEFPCRATARMG